MGREKKVATNCDRLSMCGNGIVNCPVTNGAMITEVVELKGFGRVGEWVDLSGDNYILDMIHAANHHGALVEALTGLCNIATHPKATRADIRQIAQEARAALAAATE